MTNPAPNPFLDTMKNKPTPPTTIPRTIVIAGDDKGGVTKSTSCACVADSLKALGYTVCLADADARNRTLSTMMPEAIKFDGQHEGELNNFIGRAAENTVADLTLIDMPGGSGKLLADYFDRIGFDAFADMGVRLVVALTLVQSPGAIKGAKAWVRTFMEEADFIVFANHRHTPLGETFNVDKFPGGKMIIQLPAGRIVEIPRWSDYMEEQFFACQRAPSSYLPGGEAAQILKLNAFTAGGWKTVHNQVTNSVAKVAEWLTGRPPTLEAPRISGKHLSATKAAFLEDLGD